MVLRTIQEHLLHHGLLTVLSRFKYVSKYFAIASNIFANYIQNDWSWRLPSLLQSICSVIILGMMWWIPESPRWLLNKDQDEKALQILSYYHAENNPQDEFVHLEFTEIRTAIALDKEADKNSWLDLVRTKGNRKRMAVITAIGFFSQWSGNGLISYYLHQVMNNVGITSASTQLGINGGLKSWGLFVNIFMAFFVDRVGRRPIYLISTIGTLFAFTIWTIISARYAVESEPNKGLGIGFVIMIFVYGSFYDFKSVFPFT